MQKFQKSCFKLISAGSLLENASTIFELSLFNYSNPFFDLLIRHIVKKTDNFPLDFWFRIRNNLIDGVFRFIQHIEVSLFMNIFISLLQNHESKQVFLKYLDLYKLDPTFYAKIQNFYQLDTIDIDSFWRIKNKIDFDRKVPQIIDSIFSENEQDEYQNYLEILKILAQMEYYPGANVIAKAKVAIDAYNQHPITFRSSSLSNQQNNSEIKVKPNYLCSRFENNIVETIPLYEKKNLLEK
jgi:hypothetical protein